MSWTKANNGLTTNIFAVNGSYIFAGTSKGIFRSSDNGTNWIYGNSGIPNDGSVSSFTVSDSIIFAGIFSWR